MKNKMIDIELLKKNAERATDIISSIAVITQIHLEILEKNEMDNATFDGGVETLKEYISILKESVTIGLTLIDENGSDSTKELEIHEELESSGIILALIFRSAVQMISEFESRLEKVKENGGENNE